MPKYTPLYSARPKSVRDTLSGKFVTSGPSKTADVLTGAGVSKRNASMTDAQIRRRKKIQSNISMAGGTLGLAALGAKGGSVATAGGKAGRFLKVKPNAALSEKLDRSATGLTTVGAGIGGVGAYNFASYTRAEGLKPKLPVVPRSTVKRRQRDPLAKNWEGPMDFGLGGVQQGVEISKKQDWQNIEEHKRRARDSRRHKSTAIQAAGWGGSALYFTAAHHQMKNLGSRNPTPGVLEQAGAVSRGAYNAAQQRHSYRKLSPELRGPFNAANTKALKGVVRANKHGVAALASTGLLAGGTAAALGWRANERRHDQAIARLRRQRATKSVRKSLTPIDEVSKRKLGFSRGSATYFPSKVPGHWVSQMHGPKTPFNNRSLKAITQDTNAKVVARYEHPATLNRTGKITAGTTGTAAVITGGEAVRRKVKKAYDPERKRQNRTRTYADAGFLAAGGVGTAAVLQGNKARKAGQQYRAGKEFLGHKPDHFGSTESSVSRTLAATRNDLNSSRAALGETQKELRAARGAHRAGVTALGHGGRAAALGIGAAGLAMGSHRIRQYSKGKGRSYKPLRSIEY